MLRYLLVNNYGGAIMRYVIMFFLGLCVVCVWGCEKSDKEVACTSWLRECRQMQWQDGKCVDGEVVPDGEKCLRKFHNGFCVSECICQDGTAKYKKRVCDNGNPCFIGLCEQERIGDGLRSGPEQRNMCFFYPGNDGKTCGKDNTTGVCLQGLCIKQDAIIPPSPAPLVPVFSFSP